MRGFRAYGRLLSIGRQAGPRFAENLITVPEAFFFIERVGVRTRVGAQNEDEKGSLRREQTRWNVDCGYAGLVQMPSRLRAKAHSSNPAILTSSTASLIINGRTSHRHLGRCKAPRQK